MREHEPIGVGVFDPGLTKEGSLASNIEIATIPPKKQKSIINKIKKIMDKYNLDDKEWAEAISAQYYLISLVDLLKINRNRQDYKNLLNKVLIPFNITFDGELTLDDSKIQKTPEETLRIIESMQEEDASDPYYCCSAKLSASNIDANKMYYNFHYSLLLRCSFAVDTSIFKKLRKLCVENLFQNDVIEDSGGWYPYRVPWITARILTNLTKVDIEKSENANDYDQIINEAFSSLIERIDDNERCWRSGFGKWVRTTESTAICLEALYCWDRIEQNRKVVESIIKRFFTEKSSFDELTKERDFSSESSANDILSSVTLCSIAYRITQKYYPDIFEEINEKIVVFLANVINKIDKFKVNDDRVQQYCTIPQILYYTSAAFT